MTSPRPGSRLQTTRAQSPVKSGLNPTASTNNHRSAGPYPGQTTTSSSSSSQRRGALFVDLVFADSARVPPLHEDNWDLPGDHNERESCVPGARTNAEAVLSAGWSLEQSRVACFPSWATL